MGDDKKPAAHITAQELQSSGLLQEINRRMLHPLGLSLGFVTSGSALDAGRKLTEYGPSVFFIRDQRDDLEGVYYGDDDLDENCQKVDDLEAERRPAREAALGFWVEPAGAETGPDTPDLDLTPPGNIHLTEGYSDGEAPADDA